MNIQIIDLTNYNMECFDGYMHKNKTYLENYLKRIKMTKEYEVIKETKPKWYYLNDWEQMYNIRKKEVI